MGEHNILLQLGALEMIQSPAQVEYDGAGAVDDDENLALDQLDIAGPEASSESLDDEYVGEAPPGQDPRPGEKRQAQHAAFSDW